MSIFKIYSGGQTGVDRAALDAAIEHGIPHGGWCPANRIAEDGRIDEKYQLQETSSKGYVQRTKKNIEDSEATLIIYNDSLKGGSLLTYNYAVEINKPVFLLDLSVEYNPGQINNWINDNSINLLNIAGPRESQNKGIYLSAKRIIGKIILDMNTSTNH